MNPTPRQLYGRGYDIRKTRQSSARPSGKPLNKTQVKEVREISKSTTRTLADHKSYYEDIQIFAGDTGSFVKFEMPPKGDGGGNAGERIGNEFRVKSLDVRYTIYQADTSNVCRVIFGLWHDQTTPAPSQVLNIAATTLVSNVLAHPNNLNSKQFKILSDRTHVFPTNSSFNPQYYRFIKAWKKGLPIQMSGDTPGSLAYRNNLFVLFITDSTAITHPNIDISTKMDYMDV